MILEYLVASDQFLRLGAQQRRYKQAGSYPHPRRCEPGGGVPAMAWA